jgi:23S rRNA (cytosine1962-C5)-methyltransferase
LQTAIRHPLVYRKRIRRVDAAARPGDMVAVYCPRENDGESHSAELLGYGLYNPKSEIAVRMLRFDARLPDDRFWNELLGRAVSFRREVLRLDDVTDAYRVIHGEADGLPGLVVDRFGDVLSAEAFSLGMLQRCPDILARLADSCGTRHFWIRTSPHFLSHEGIDSPPVSSNEAPRSITISEHGMQFRVRFGDESHKTGFFCDQRENRFKLAGFCKNRSVLDLCCYSGGFAIQAKRSGQAAEVIGVDLDEQPLRLARENANLNRVRIKFVQADVFPYMRDMLRLGRQFDVVVLDPPKLIRSRDEIDEGTRKYFDLNRLAMQLVRPGGILLSCTCSGLMPQAEFLRILYGAARQAGPASAGQDERLKRGSRNLRVFAKTGAAADHPVAGNCPETEYLNAIWMNVDDPF